MASPRPQTSRLRLDDFRRLGVRPQEYRSAVIRQAARQQAEGLAAMQLTAPTKQTGRELSRVATSAYRLLDPRNRRDSQQRVRVGRILPQALSGAAETGFHSERSDFGESPTATGLAPFERAAMSDHELIKRLEVEPTSPSSNNKKSPKPHWSDSLSDDDLLKTSPMSRRVARMRSRSTARWLSLATVGIACCLLMAFVADRLLRDDGGTDAVQARLGTPPQQLPTQVESGPSDSSQVKPAQAETDLGTGESTDEPALVDLDRAANKSDNSDPSRRASISSTVVSDARPALDRAQPVSDSIGHSGAGAGAAKTTDLLDVADRPKNVHRAGLGDLIAEAAPTDATVGATPAEKAAESQAEFSDSAQVPLPGPAPDSEALDFSPLADSSIESESLIELSDDEVLPTKSESELLGHGESGPTKRVLLPGLEHLVEVPLVEVPLDRLASTPEIDPSKDRDALAYDSEITGQSMSVLPSEHENPPSAETVTQIQRELAVDYPVLGQPFDAIGAVARIKQLESLESEFEKVSAEHWVIHVWIAEAAWLEESVDSMKKRLAVLAQSYDFPISDVLADTFVAASGHASSSETRAHILNSGLRLADSLLLDSSDEACREVIDVLRDFTSARPGRETIVATYLSDFRKAAKTIGNRASTAERVKQSKDEPTKVERRALGRHYCLMLRDWETGLLWLPDASNTRISLAAREELKLGDDRSAESVYGVAKLWMAAADNDNGRAANSMRLHALELLKLAHDESDALTEHKIDLDMEEVTAAIPDYLLPRSATNAGTERSQIRNSSSPPVGLPLS